MNINQKGNLLLSEEKMYSNWSSFCSSIQNNNLQDKSVLAKLPISTDAAKQIVTLVVQPIAANIGINLPASLSKLNTEKEVNWCMEVLEFGLSLPLNEHDIIRDCVHVYCEWLSVLLPQPKSAVPLPLLKLPNHFSRKIISHLYHLFVPRPGDAAADMISRQALLCHRVLRTFQLVVIQSSILEEETWDSLLLFLLAINDTLLAPPTNPNDIGDQLCDRVLSVLLEVWLYACARNFPSPRLWKTLTELAQTWRHRTSLVSQWNRINLALTARLLRDLYGSSFPNVTTSDEDRVLVPFELTGELLAQTWYRLLHCIGNPVQLARPGIISSNTRFLQYTIINSQLTDPTQHPCLALLPNIFVEAMRGVAMLVDQFLFLPPTQRSDLQVTLGSTQSDHEGILSSFPSYHSRCNSLLHLFGAWLFEAALLDCEASQTKTNVMDNRMSSPLMTDRSRASSVSIASEASVLSNRPRSSTVVELSETSGPPNKAEYEHGRAEALGALCRIFSSKRTDEDILPQYLARFFVVLHNGLKIKEDRVVGEAAASILLHSTDLMRVDLDGIFSVLPSFVEALEAVLLAKDVKIRHNVNRVELRRASIHILISILAVPLHFHQLHIKDLSSSIGDRGPSLTFSHLRPRLTQLLLSALQTETDSSNTHLLLGGLSSFIHDFGAFEQTEVMARPPQEYLPAGQTQHDSSSTIISSTSDTHSCHSTSSTSYPSMSDMTSDSHHPDQDASFAEKLPFINPLSWSLHGLVNAAINVVSHKLLSVWKLDLNTSLAAVELLGCLSKITFAEQGECRRVVRVLCEYITHQCSRPPPAHSKDLHSTIVAAFLCCASWLFAHPYILTENADCLHALLQVIELGISGSKSQGKVGEIMKLKCDKDLKPVSLRVRDAAELLLTSLVEKVGNYPNPCKLYSRSSSLDEGSLFQRSSLQNSPFHRDILPSSAIKHFRYFATADGAILGVLEEPLDSDQDPKPNVTLLLRNAFGKQVWASHLRHLPRHKCGCGQISQNTNPGRPLPMNDVGIEPIHKLQNFPDSIDRVRPCLADKSLPFLDGSVVVDDTAAQDLDHISRMVEISSKFVVCEKENFGKMEYQPPSLRDEFQSARLFLSHMGFLSLDTLLDTSLNGGSSLVGLSSTAVGFSEELEVIDSLGSRTCDVVQVFYVRSGQKSAEEIKSNMMSSSSIDPRFFEFLDTLGWSLDAHLAPKDLNSGYSIVCEDIIAPKLRDSKMKLLNNEDCLAADDISSPSPSSQIFYWADGLGEIFFTVPCSGCSIATSSPSPPFHRKSPRRQSMRKTPVMDESIDAPKRRRTVKHTAPFNTSDPKMAVVWLESFQDCMTFPLRELLGLVPTPPDTGYGGNNKITDQTEECFVVFIHPQQSGLYRIHLRGPQSRIHFATPLVDGITVSHRVLGALVRQTTLNMAKRRRLDQESYQLPHVKRKLKIAELVSRFRSGLEMPRFYTNLFSS